MPTFVERICDNCGKVFQARRCEIRRALERGHRPVPFCSRSCKYESYVGEGNPKWRGGRTLSAGGYIHILLKDHPQADYHGYYEEHRYVVEQHLGRILRREEQVHHKNHDRTDNRLENLALMASSAEHRREHAHYQAQPCDWCGKLVVRSEGHRRRKKHAFCNQACSSAFGSRKNQENAWARKQLLLA